jgi:hypothetical protein
MQQLVYALQFQGRAARTDASAQVLIATCGALALAVQRLMVGRSKPVR